MIELGIGSAPNPGASLGMNALAFDESERLLYASTSTHAAQGLLVVDPEVGRLVDQIDLWPENDRFLGGALDLLLDEDRLVGTSVNSVTGEGRVVIVPITDPTALQFGSTGDPTINVAQAPDGRDYALTSARAVQLMDATTLEVIWEDRPPPPTDVRLGVGFRPDGHVFFVTGAPRDRAPIGAPNELTIYLYR